MFVNAILCNHCGDIVYSRATHDMRYCGCGKVAIDGGLEYVKVSAPDSESVTSVLVDVDAKPAQLYEDWNLDKDKFGLMKSKDADMSRMAVYSRPKF